MPRGDRLGQNEEARRSHPPKVGNIMAQNPFNIAQKAIILHTLGVHNHILMVREVLKEAEATCRANVVEAVKTAHHGSPNNVGIRSLAIT